MTPTTDPLLQILTGHTDEVWAVAISADGSTAISGSEDGSVRVWDLAGGGEPRALTGHTGPVWAVAISADGSTAISGSEDGSVRVWDLVEERCIASWVGDYSITGCNITLGRPLKVGVAQSHGNPYTLELRGTA